MPTVKVSPAVAVRAGFHMFGEACCGTAMFPDIFSKSLAGFMLFSLFIVASLLGLH